MKVHVCGIDIGKTVFHRVGLSKEGHIATKKRFSRKQLVIFAAKLPTCLIGMEACPGAHFLARVLLKQGHDVELMPAEYVRPVVKSNKNDYVDAEAIAEAVQRPTMRFVPVKNEAQLDLQALHRVRDRWMGRRTAVIKQLRGFLIEHGITIAAGPAHLKRQIPSILENADNLLSPRMRMLLLELRDEWDKLEQQIDAINKELVEFAKNEDNCRRLLTIPGVGPPTATALTAANWERNCFPQGPGPRCVAWPCSPATLHGWQGEVVGDKQARRPVSATAVRSWRSRRVRSGEAGTASVRGLAGSSRWRIRSQGWDGQS